MSLYAYDTEEKLALAKEIRSNLYKFDRPAQNTIASLDQVTEADIQRFWQEGYLVIEQAYTQEEVAQYLEAIEDIMFERVKGPKIQFTKPQEQLKTDEERELSIRKINNFIQHDKRLHHAGHHPGILDLMTKLFQDVPRVVQDQAILKPPSGGAEKPWHQDMAYGNLTYQKPVIGVWTALDPATLENGCMHLIPRSHMDGPTPHYSVRDWQICDANVPVEKDVVVPLNPGGILVFHGMLFHGTPPNFTTQRRRSVQFHYAPETALKMSPEEYKRWFTNEMTNAEC